MSNQGNRRAEIIGVGAYVPPKVFTNFDLEEMLNTSDEWIQQRTGIVERHWVEGDIGTSDLAVKASEEAISEAGIDKKDIDCIIFATLSPDHDFPGSGCFLQAKLDLPGIAAFDIRQQCTGFIYGLSMADALIRSGQFKNILLVGAEVHSKGLDLSPEGRNVSVLFGDGAGAVVLTAKEAKNDEDSQLFRHNLHADGSYAKELWVAAPGTGNGPSHRLSPEMMEEKLHYPYMNGRQVFMHAVKGMSRSLTQTLKEQEMTVDDVDLFLFHQANLRINDKVGEMMGISSDKVFNTIQNYGNTTAATIPIGMRDAIKAGVLKKGMTVAMAAFGSGFTWGSTVMRY
ncbi:MAG: 3-oxoacyl-ACP synthase [Halobacteriovoraceae bacterium]|nr:3-oxoacyl-ACP synthase [Halobacteriovoraceae bacterium]